MEEQASVVGGGRVERERERKRPLLLFLYVFSFPLGLPYANWASAGAPAWFYLKSSLRPSNLPLTFLCSVFSGLSLPHLLATAILDSFSRF